MERHEPFASFSVAVVLVAAAMTLAVAAAAVVAERSLRSRRRTTVAVTRAMIIQIVIGQSELNHRLSRRLTVLGDVDADFILGSDFGRDPSPLGGVGAEPNVGTHFHFGFKF